MHIPSHPPSSVRTAFLGAISLSLLALNACGPAESTLPDDVPSPRPEYDRQTGRLKEATWDRNQDGHADAWAHFEGQQLSHIELDRDGDEHPDRVEFYVANATPDPSAPFGGALIERAEEWIGSNRTITRRESYEQGSLVRVEEDVDADGRFDKWEVHRSGRLVHMDLDLQGRGVADRRLIYADGGRVERVEVDPEGDGVFEIASAKVVDR
jgi:hypothetical protein